MCSNLFRYNAALPQENHPHKAYRSLSLLGREYRNNDDGLRVIYPDTYIL